MFYRDATTAEESAYEKCLAAIAKVDGRALFESGNVTMDDGDGMFDVYGLPSVFDASLAGDTWADMTPDEQARWDALAAAIAAFAEDRLDYDLAMDHADRI